MVVKGGGFELVMALKMFYMLGLVETFLQKHEEVSVQGMCGMVGIGKVG